MDEPAAVASPSQAAAAAASKALAAQMRQSIDYLKRCPEPLESAIAELLVLLLNNRPAKPLALMAAFFEHKRRHPDVEYTAYQYIASSPRHRQIFVANLAVLYDTVIEHDSESGSADNDGMTGRDLVTLVQTLCRDFPAPLLERIVAVLGHRLDDAILFTEFLPALNAALLHETLLEAASAVFAALDTGGTGTVPRRYLEALQAELRALLELAPRPEGLAEWAQRMAGSIGALAVSGPGGERVTLKEWIVSIGR
eukprot:c56189_g1_i1.p1 GENE.c56189_g1_i1~~c56189_g1_i1.p1  ORF type:complete len:254 (+),score=48.98 c56189_g1_i1:40-801(+)